jgi:hypothetical protein
VYCGEALFEGDDFTASACRIIGARRNIVVCRKDAERFRRRSAINLDERFRVS